MTLYRFIWLCCAISILLSWGGIVKLAWPGLVFITLILCWLIHFHRSTRDVRARPSRSNLYLWISGD